MTPDLSRITSDLAALVRIPSVNPYDAPPGPGLREAEVADWLLAAMAEIGLETGRFDIAPGRPNVWGRLKGAGSGPTLMLSGHMDTVGVEDYAGDPFAAEIRDGRLHGRGAVDMKGGLATMLETARLAKGRGFAGDLLLYFVADEEHLMKGSIAAGRRGVEADFCIVTEPSSLAVASAHKGQSAFEIEIAGRAVHSSRPELGDNALAAAARVIDGALRFNETLLARDPHPMLEHGRMTPVMLSGGESHSAVPGRATLTIDRRTLPGESREEIRAELAAIIAEAGAEATIRDPAPEARSLDTPRDHPLVAATMAAAESLGVSPEPFPFPGSTDAPNFGVPALICGPGDLTLAHTADEWIELDQTARAALLYLRVAETLIA